VYRQGVLYGGRTLIKIGEEVMGNSADR
jgi:hypothetical protein